MRESRIFQNLEAKKARQFVDTLIKEGHSDISMNPWSPKKGHYIVEWTNNVTAECNTEEDCRPNCPSWAGAACTCGKVADAIAKRNQKSSSDEPKTDIVAEEKKEPSAEQIAALKKFAAAKGNKWKSALRNAWMAGGYDSDAGEFIDGPLQQLRNSFGPSWLANHKISQ